MYEKPAAGAWHWKPNTEEIHQFEQRLPGSHCCEDIWGKAEHNPKIFQVWCC